MSYVAAGVFVAGWLLYAYGARRGTLRQTPRWARAMVVVALAGAALSATTLQLAPDAWVDVTVDWASLHYRFPAPNALGSAITCFYLVAIGCVCLPFLRERPGDERRWEYLVGFSVFLAATVVEVLVTNGVIRFPFIADIGFIAVVIPMAAETVRRFIEDARRLSGLSTHLTEEIEIRTQERDEAHHAWIEAERQAAVGRLAAGVGHEINNPLAYLRLNLELIGEWGREHSAPSELMESVDGALDGADRIRRVVDALRASSRPGSGVHVPLALDGVTQAALRMAAHQLRGITLEVDPGDGATVTGDETRLVQAIVNLLLNAAQGVRQRTAAGVVGGEPPRIRVCVGNDREGRAVLEVADNGAGIAREDLRRLMQPYFSTRGGAGGIGFGLFLARGVFEQHGGTIEVESEPSVGTRVRVLLPAAGERPASVLESVQGASATAGRGSLGAKGAGSAMTRGV
ncbi:MAG TPA: HAMP domain-containing sensor histidine kinase, partial [Gemmatimonadaceae bacterium]|nr:HAMP domain-containing sensor histidine kinase [Gemmatimonadaceae bacterium]